MAIAVKLSDSLLIKARIHAKIFHRSAAGQVEYWARIGQIAEENPELSFAFIQNILLGLEEVKAGKFEPYIFGEGDERNNASRSK